MCARPVFHPDLGEFFTGLRKRRQWGQSQAVNIAQRRGLTHLTRQVVFRLEKGKTKWPAQEVLRDLSELYDYPYSELLAEVVKHSYGVEAAELLTGTGPVIAPSKSWSSQHDALTSEIGVLTQQRDAAVEALADVLADLRKILDRHDADGQTVHRTASTKTRARRRD